jgi:hypothetical protein
MKKLIVASLVVMSTASFADGHHHGHHHGHHNQRPEYRSNSDWVAPLIIGGVVGAVIARESQPVIVQQPQQAPYGYHYETILDANCNCHRQVLVQNR